MLLEGTYSSAARALFERDPDWRSENYIPVELSNVLVTTMRVRDLPLAKAQAVFADARLLIEPGLVTVEHAEAVSTAHRFRITACDARFITAARGLGTKLVTEDAKLRSAAKAFTQTLAQALET